MVRIAHWGPLISRDQKMRLGSVIDTYDMDSQNKNLSVNLRSYSSIDVKKFTYLELGQYFNCLVGQKVS